VTQDPRQENCGYGNTLSSPFRSSSPRKTTGREGREKKRKKDREEQAGREEEEEEKIRGAKPDGTPGISR